MNLDHKREVKATGKDLGLNSMTPLNELNGFDNTEDYLGLKRSSKIVFWKNLNLSQPFTESEKCLQIRKYYGGTSRS